jgi:hypothetical protein
VRPGLDIPVHYEQTVRWRSVRPGAPRQDQVEAEGQCRQDSVRGKTPQMLLTTSLRVRERMRDRASACMRRHQAFALAPLATSVIQRIVNSRFVS